MSNNLHDTGSPASYPVDGEIVAGAFSLFDAGLNVFPIRGRSKLPYGKHDFLNTTRLYRPGLISLVAGSNLAVMTGRLSGNLVVLDCDTPDVFSRVKESLNAGGLYPWIRNSVRGGQLWLRCSDGEVANGKHEDVDILGNRKYSVVPPSIHPTGMAYQWLEHEGEAPPVVPLAQLTKAIPFLSLRLVQRTQRITLLEKSSALPPVANRVLVEQNTSNYASNSEAEYAACLSMIGACYSDGDILRFFEKFPPSHYSKVGEDDFRRYILGKARRDHDLASQSSSDPSSHSSEVKKWAESRPWLGRSGNSDRVVFLALCERMRMDGGMPFRASIREIAELAGVDKMTVERSMKRLKATGLIRISTAIGINAVTFILPKDDKQDNDIVHTVGVAYTPVRDSVCIKSAAHDAWHPHALGKSALACWSILLGDPGLTTAELAKRTGRHKVTVSRALGKLVLHGLVRKDENEQWTNSVVTVDCLDKIASRYKTLGKAELRVSRNADERSKFASSRIAKQIEQYKRKLGTTPEINAKARSRSDKAG